MRRSIGFFSVMAALSRMAYCYPGVSGGLHAGRAKRTCPMRKRGRLDEQRARAEDAAH